MSAPGAETAEQIDNQRNDQDETEATTTVGRAAVVKAATAEEEHQEDNHEDKIHALTLPAHGGCAYGAFTCWRVGDQGAVRSRSPSNLAPENWPPSTTAAVTFVQGGREAVLHVEFQQRDVFVGNELDGNRLAEQAWNFFRAAVDILLGLGGG